MNAGRCLTAVALLLASAPSFAQRLAESVQVTLVEVPVTVVGADGKPVRGLTREQFELFDDNRRVAVEHFEVIDVVRLSADGGEAHPAAIRNFLLFFDLANSSPGTIERASDVRADGSTQPARVTLAGRVAADTPGGARLLFDFDPEGLQSGSYELRLTVKPQTGDQSVMVLPFRIR